ncbi:MAG: apolipoprotein N-acyltransferase, partial [Alphaproteobacteria bacterium]
QRDLLPLLQVGELAGPYPLSFAMAWLANAVVRRPLDVRRLAAPVLTIAALWCWGTSRIDRVDREVEQAPPFTVGIVQGNVGLGEKRHAARFEDNVERYRRLSRDLAPTPDLLVWPETVVEWGVPHDSDPPSELDAFPGAPTPLVFGAVSWSRRKGDPVWYNSAFLRGADGRLRGAYDKIVLMPFGEFIPFASTWPWLKTLSPATGDFAPGAGPGVLEVSPRAKVGPLICYEDLLSGHVRATVDAGATLLATIANDAWFGDTAALHQHEMLALWRAVENRRFLVRATNTGLSSVVDPVGRRIATLPVEREAAIAVQTRLLDGATPDRRLGDLFAWTTVLATAWLARSPREARSDAPGTPPGPRRGRPRRGRA